MGQEAKFDYIIVGGGSAGCAAAGRLVDKYGARVLLLEAGIRDKNPLIRMPAGSFKLVFGAGPEMHYHVSAPQPALDGRSLTIPQASVLGGGSSVNAMGYVRGTPSDYDEWADLVGREWGWDWKGLLEYFREQEGNIRLNNAFHGVEGPCKVSDPLFIDEASHRFVQTMQAMGLPYLHDFNAEEKFGVGYFQTATYRGRRWSAADAFVHTMAHPDRLDIRTGAPVDRILFDGNRAIGVEYRWNGKTERVMAREEVLIAAGALVSPKLLMLSGIGEAEQLRSHGIEVRADVPGVGKNLLDHAMVALSTRATTRGYFGEDKGLRMIRNGIQYKIFGTGPVTTNGAETHAMVRIGNCAEPNVQIYHVSVMWPNAPVEKPAPGVTLFANLVRPHSRGEVRLRSAKSTDGPLVDPNFLADSRDMDVMIQSMRYLRDITKTGPYGEITGDEVMPGPAVASDEQWRNYIKQAVETDYHPCGTCKMGAEDDPMAVLDPTLKVRGIEGLRVIDASMMPKIPGANLNCTVTAVAAKAVDMIATA